MKRLNTAPRKRLLTSALLLALAPPLAAQVADQTRTATPYTTTSAGDATELDRVTVTGIRGSLTSSMNLKRDSQGIVDGIVAEDIGKFPDTNLAESLQRISGVSIDRTASGEGSKVTVRGVGPDFNLVLLNGRQMPASNLGPGGGGTSNSRAFDFANLASESVSEIEVFKSSRASSPTGGIGATINVKTARPLDNPGFNASVGVKGVHDTSVDNLPDAYPGSSITGELSGIFSNTSADGRFGIALSGSYQERDSGYSQASVADGWAMFRGDDTGSWNRLPLAGENGFDRITNRPGPDTIYGRPQNTGYSVNGVQRQRTNGQATFQWQPTDTVRTTLDYTYAENKVQQQRNELSVWFNYGPGDSSWTDGPIAAPIVYGEDHPTPADIAMGGMELATRNTLESAGFNIEWDAADSLKLHLDYHSSTAESRPDSPFGSAGVLGTAAFRRASTSVDYSGDFPILTIGLPPGVDQIAPSDVVVTGSVFQNSYNKSEVEQVQAGGRFTFENYSNLDFGVSMTEVNNRTASAVSQSDTWGGVGSPADYDDSIFYADDMSRYFGAFDGHNDPRFTGRFMVFDFDRLRNRVAEFTGNEALYRAPTQFTQDLRTEEKSKAAYVQWSTEFDWSMPLRVAAGVRYEETDVTSSSLVRVGTGISWNSANELYVVYDDEREFQTQEATYDHFLPSLDMSLQVAENMVLRGSYSQTLGRPGWQQIQGGLTLADIVRVDGGDGSLGNPALEPLKSTNFDLSFEWYYGEASYVSVGWFRKNIQNFISDTIVRDTPYNLHTPVGGTYWNNAIASGVCAGTDMPCIRNYIFLNHAGDPGVTYTGINDNGERTGSIVGLPTDPIAGFDINTPANQRSDSLDGWEFNVQHMFGQSGFGVAANYTIVDSGLTFDNLSLGDQYPMVGLSDSANVVAFYDKNQWQVRAAYNWRDEFLSGIGGQGPNPNYTEAYGQLDLNISYQVTPQFSLHAEAINLTDETYRTHARHTNQLRFATQTGPRYMFGARYRF